jgi:hypothetical protein
LGSCNFAFSSPFILWDAEAPLSRRSQSLARGWGLAIQALTLKIVALETVILELNSRKRLLGKELQPRIEGHQDSAIVKNVVLTRDFWQQSSILPRPSWSFALKSPFLKSTQAED